MSEKHQTSEEVVVVGGGFAGLSIATLLAQHEIPVTLLEAADLGFEASSRNQGWLYSGAWFARRQQKLARLCHDAWRKTIEFCPSCLEPGHTGTTFAFAQDNSEVTEWTQAWETAEIPYQQYSTEQLSSQLENVDTSTFKAAFHLPDRSFRPQALLRHLADIAVSRGVRIHTNCTVDKINVAEHNADSVTTSKGEKLNAAFVVLATGSGQQPVSISQDVAETETPEQSLYTRVTLQTHLVAATPQLCPQPFCIVDCEGFNHMPHRSHNELAVSVFGMDRWKVVNNEESVLSDNHESQEIRERIERFLPAAQTSDVRWTQWSGTTVQAMHIDQIDPGYIPLPTVIDHARESPCVRNMMSVFPGRATLWAQLAEDAAELILKRLERSPVLTCRPPWA